MDGAQDVRLESRPGGTLSMRAAFLRGHGGPEVIEIGDLPAPEPQAGEVRVRVKFAALNHLDLWIRGGLPGLKLDFPHILGADAAGIVDKTGAGVTKWKPGDEVVIHPGISCGKCEQCLTGVDSLCRDYKLLGENTSGTDAELVVVPEVNVFAKPAKLSFEAAAALPLVFVTAWEMVRRKADVKPGQWVLVHAAGSGVSTAAIQIAHLAGAKVIATSGSDEKLDRAKALGAAHTINTQAQDFQAEVKKLVKGGVDVIVDHVGAAFWEKNVRALKSGGTLVTCGATSGPLGVTDLRHLFFRQLKLVGSTMGSKRDFPEILRLVNEGKLEPIVSKIFPLGEIRSAHEHLQRAAQFGKVVLAL